MLNNNGLKQETPNAPHGNPLKVLIADDSERVRKLLVNLLLQCPRLQLVGQAQDGSEALDLIKTLDPDVLIVDVQMPRVSGLKVLEALKNQGSKCMTIVLTGQSDDAYRKKCSELGATHFFEKGTSIDQLIRVLKQL